MTDIKTVPTCQLVDELCRREGVAVITAEPHKDATVDVSGPAIALIVTD